jgi:hypothetical protein
MPSHFKYRFLLKSWDSIYRLIFCVMPPFSTRSLLVNFLLLIEWCKIRVNFMVELLKCAWSNSSVGVMRASSLINVDQNLKLTLTGCNRIYN